jgi:hypothetical protein
VNVKDGWCHHQLTQPFLRRAAAGVPLSCREGCALPSVAAGFRTTAPRSAPMRSRDTRGPWRFRDGGNEQPIQWRGSQRMQDVDAIARPAQRTRICKSRPGRSAQRPRQQRQGPQDGEADSRDPDAPCTANKHSYSAAGFALRVSRARCGRVPLPVPEQRSGGPRCVCRVRHGPHRECRRAPTA